MKRKRINGFYKEETKGNELPLACGEGRLDDVKRLVAEGVSLNREYRNEFYKMVSPLWFACVGDHLEVVRFLLDNGADPNYGSDPPLCKVCRFCQSNCLAIAQLLLDRGADVNFMCNTYGTPLMQACFCSEPPIALIEFLIAKGAQINAVDKWGGNALTDAVVGSHDEVAFLLLENGSEVVGGINQWLIRMIVKKNQSDVPRMNRLLRIAWERGARKINIAWERGTRGLGSPNVRDKITLPSWSPTTHWIYSFGFKQQVKTILMVWKRSPQFPKKIALIIIQKLATYETKTVYHDEGQQ